METSLINKNILFVVILSSMISCQDEEFYEKNYLEKIGAPGPEIINDTIDDIDDTIDDLDPNDDNTVQLLQINDSFTQTSQSKPIDIVWVIDNSGSMQDEQEDLADNFESFIESFSQKNIDFKMSIITTDTTPGKAGVPVAGSIEKLTSVKMNQNKSQFISDFSTLIKVGTRGSGYEKGIKASDEFIKSHQQSFLREDAYLVTVYVSDEEDQSEETTLQYYNNITSSKSNDGLYKAYSIVDINTTQTSSYGMLIGHERYEDMTEYSNGKLSDLRSNFHTTLAQMGDEISDLASQFPLSKKPYDENKIQVYVNQVLVSNWSYNSSTNSIEFAQSPTTNAHIEINYSTEK